MRYRSVLLLILVALTCASCTPRGAAPASAPAPSAAPAASETPTATIKSAWFWASGDKDLMYFRSVATIHNPGTRTLEGVRVEWVVYDSEGTIVGSYKAVEPAIAAGGDAPYVAGAGGPNLSGTPARIEYRITDAGHFIDSPPAAYGVSGIKITRDSRNVYSVKAKARTGAEEVKSSDLFADLVLKDKDGKIVGGDFWFPSNLPDTIPPGSSFAVDFQMVRTTGKADTASVTVTERRNDQ
jgi:hypothetical protein